jgi:hypothetical protein
VMFCDKCGAELNPGAGFCPQCGRRIRPSSMPESSRAARRTEVVQPRIRSRVPGFVSRLLRPGEEVLGCFPCLVRTSGRKARSESGAVILTTDRLIMARRTLFSHNVEEAPYSRIPGVGHDRRWFRSAVTLRLPGAGLTIRKISKDDALFIDLLVTGRRAGVTFETARSSSTSLYAAPRQSAAPGQNGYVASAGAPAALQAPRPSGAGRNLSAMDPLEFEELVRQLLETMGYQARLTKASHDDGVDIEAYNPQPIVGGKIVVQCKRYSGVVGAPYIRDLAGVVQHEGATKGILVTTSHFSPDAQSFARGKPLELIDGPQLEALLDRHGLAVSTVNPLIQQHIAMPTTPISMGGPVGAAMPSFRSSMGWRRAVVKTVSWAVALVALTLIATGIAGYGPLASLWQGRLAPSPAAPPSGPSLRLSPGRAIAGARVRLMGVGFVAHEATRIYWVTGHRWQRIAQTRTGGHGVLRGVAVHVPRAAAPGRYHIAAVQTVGGARGRPPRKQQAWASFVVLGAHPRGAAHGPGS